MLIYPSKWRSPTVGEGKDRTTRCPLTEARNLEFEIKRVCSLDQQTQRFSSIELLAFHVLFVYPSFILGWLNLFRFLALL